jgi:competence protein ComEC
LLGGILLGAKEDMGKKLLDDFRKTGVIHIVVLSGYNLTLVAEFFIKIFAFLGIGLSAIFGAASIIFFTIMTGASSTIIRASIMALLILFARSTGRESETVRALFFAGFIMLIFNPMLLVFDPSFQLSFLATLGLLILSPKIEEKLKFIPKKFFDFRGILAATLSTQIFVFPLLLYMMGEISIISPLVNVLILVTIPFAMLLGLIAVLFSYVNFSFGLIISYVVYLILAYDLFLVNFFANFSFAVFESNIFNFWFMFF